MQTQPFFSLVIPVYRNEANVSALVQAVDQLARTLSRPMEVVFVIDGSPDRSFPLLKDALIDRPSSTLSFGSQLIQHSRNFGSFAAIRTGLQHARGSCFAVMAADLQEPPELIASFFSSLEKDECDVAVGSREGRDDPAISRMMSALFWFSYRALVQSEIPPGGVDVFGCNRKFRDALLELDESHSSLVGLIYWLGFRRITVPYRRLKREAGKSAWTLKRKLRYLSDSVYSFSDLPIRALLAVGSIGLLASFSLATVIVALKLTGALTVPGYAATATMILFFMGLNCFGLGIIGAYVWRTYENTKRRPSSIVMSIDENAREPERA